MVVVYRKFAIQAQIRPEIFANFGPNPAVKPGPTYSSGFGHKFEFSKSNIIRKSFIVIIGYQ